MNGVLKNMKDYYNFWRSWPYDNHWINSTSDIKDVYRAIMNRSDFFERADIKKVVRATVKRGGKTYRVTVEEIKPKPKDDLEVEFDGDEPDKHPDYTE